MKSESSGRPLVNAVVRSLREELLQRVDGECLGSENEMVERFKVSRATLRQAARLLEQEQLLRVRRGNNGGYFVARPDDSAAARAAAIYLRLHHANLGHLIDAGKLLNTEIYRLAAMSTQEAGRLELRAAIDSLRVSTLRGQDSAAFWKGYLRYRKALEALSGNPFLALFFGITKVFGLHGTDTHLFESSPNRQDMHALLLCRIGDAVLNGQMDAVEALVSHSYEMIESWVAEDLGGQKAFDRTIELDPTAA